MSQAPSETIVRVFSLCLWRRLGGDQPPRRRDAIEQAQSESQNDVASTALGERVAATTTPGVVTKIPHNFTTSSKGELESALASVMFMRFTRGGGGVDVRCSAVHVTRPKGDSETGGRFAGSC